MSQNTKNSLILKDFNIDDDRVIVIPNGVSSDIFDVVRRTSSQNFCKNFGYWKAGKVQKF